MKTRGRRQLIVPNATLWWQQKEQNEELKVEKIRGAIIGGRPSLAPQRLLNTEYISRASEISGRNMICVTDGSHTGVCVRCKRT